MKKKFFIALLVFAMAFPLLSAVGCANNKISTKKDYYYYYFDYSIGNFVKTTDHFSFTNDSYEYYIESLLYETGEYFAKNDTVTFVPDKIGDEEDRMEIAFALNFRNGYFVNLDDCILSRVVEANDKDYKEFEGIFYHDYIGYLYFYKGKIYRSVNNSLDKNTFTIETGSYKNAGKDFLQINLDGINRYYLKSTLTNYKGYEYAALFSSFYTNKNIKLKDVKNSSIELKTTLFRKSDNNRYPIEIITWPNQKPYQNNLIFLTNNHNYEGNNLVFEGTGITYVHFYAGGEIFSKPIHILPQLQAESEPIHVSTTISYTPYNILSKTNYLTYAGWINRSYIIACDSEKVIIEKDNIRFSEAGEFDITVKVIYIYFKIDGSIEYLEDFVVLKYVAENI